MSSYMKYTVMAIDDDLRPNDKENTRFVSYNNFLKNEWIPTTIIPSPPKADLALNACGPSFDMVAINNWDSFSEALEKAKPDAFLIDVRLSRPHYSNSEEIDNLKKTLQLIVDTYADMPEYPPVFMVSGNWSDDTVSISNQAFAGLSHLKTTFSPIFLYVVSDINGFIGEASNSRFTNLKRERERIYNAISLSKQYTTKRPFSPDGDIVILHISDMQYGDKQASETADIVFNNIISTVKSLTENGKIHGVDLLVISGDLVMNGKRSEYGEFEKIEEALFQHLWPDEHEKKAYRERIIVIPGNHDYDLNYCLIDYVDAENKPKSRELDFQKASIGLYAATKETTVLNNYSEYGFTAFKECATKITGNESISKSEKLNYINNRFKPWGVRFVCLNTFSDIKAFETNKVGCDTEAVMKLVAGAQKSNDELLTICISHHSPLILSFLEGDTKDKLQTCFTLLRNSLNCRLFLGGHQHRRKSGRKSTSNDKPYLAFEAASLRIEPNTGTGKHVRGFNLLTLKKADRAVLPRPHLVGETGGFVSVIERCYYSTHEDEAVTQEMDDSDLVEYKFSADEYNDDENDVTAKFNLHKDTTALSDKDVFYNLLTESKKSKCIRRQVAAAIVLNGKILSISANIISEGRPNCADIGCLRNELELASGASPEYCRCTHAEKAVLEDKGIKWKRNGKYKLYSLTAPCKDCAALIIKKKDYISEVCYLNKYRGSGYKKTYTENGIKYSKYSY